jgi:hypothetical protein
MMMAVRSMVMMMMMRMYRWCIDDDDDDDDEDDDEFLHVLTEKILHLTLLKNNMIGYFEAI